MVRNNKKDWVGFTYKKKGNPVPHQEFLGDGALLTMVFRNLDALDCQKMPFQI